VAEIALCSIFPPVKVSVTILTIVAHIREHRLDVAFLARHPQVKTAQWVTSSVVIEIGLGANRFPCRGGMTFLTRNLHRAMWGRGGCGLRRGGSVNRYNGGHTGGHLEQQERLD
jgi:hypothetical protein